MVFLNVKENMKYKLVAVTNSGKETVLELSNTEFSTVLNALQVYENHLIDSEPLDESDIDFAEWETESKEYNDFDQRLSEFIRS
jgi:hypothetical protein